MNKAWLDAFIAVYRTESVKKASEMLYLTQPSITGRIQALEAEIGTPLFYRSRKKMTPTHAGVMLYPHAISVLDLWDKGIFEVQSLDKSFKGQLSIAVFFSGINFFSPMLIRFSEIYPGITLDVRTAHSNEITSLIKNHEVNIGLALNKGNKLVDHKELFKDEFVLVANASHPFAAKEVVYLDELKHEKFIVPTNVLLDKNELKGLDFPLQVIAEIDNLDYAKHLIRNNKGIAILPKSLIAEELEAGSFDLIYGDFVNKLALTCSHYIVWLKSDLTPIQELFIDFVMDEIHKMRKGLGQNHFE